MIWVDFHEKVQFQNGKEGTWHSVGREHCDHVISSDRFNWPNKRDLNSRTVACPRPTEKQRFKQKLGLALRARVRKS